MSTITTTTSESVEEIQSRHRKELKALEAEKRIALKKIKGTAGKSKKGKEALAASEEEWSSKEQDMAQRHATELQNLIAADPTLLLSTEKESSSNKEEEAKSVTTTTTTTTTTGKEEKARQKKLAKKRSQAAKNAAREAAIAAEIEDSRAISPRQLEMDRMEELYLKPQNLEIVEVAADGNCLYRAIALGASSGDVGYKDMRQLCAKILREHEELYAPFCDYSDHGVSTFEEYVQKVQSSNEWGGQVELRALSLGLNKRICVYSAEGAPLVMGGNDDNHHNQRGIGNNVEKRFVDGTEETDMIRVSFHRHYYALGEHYNLVVERR